MKLLIAAATAGEIEPFLAHLQSHWTLTDGIYRHKDHELHICITGVGMMAATYALTKAFDKGRFDFALQAGVAGSFDTAIDLGQIVVVQSEQLGDLGAEDKDKYLDIYDLGLLQKETFPYTEGKLDCPLHEIPFAYRLLTVSGLTVNTVSGNAPTIKNRMEAYGCQVESMEGAAFHYVCLSEMIPFVQVRAISNYVEPRDKTKWKMKEAIIGLNKWMIGLSNYLP